MNLIVDIGNTQTKLAIYQEGQQIYFESTSHSLANILSIIKCDFPEIRQAIVASVRKNAEDVVEIIQQNQIQCFLLNPDLPIPLENLYESKNTLGYDRLAACVGANKIYPDSNILVIDAGTAITFDFVNCKKQYLGGTISPGISMRYRALNQFTQKLPLLEMNSDYQLIGANTNEAIIGGVQNGIIFEVDTYINELREKYSDLKTIITGGDGSFIKEHLKNEIQLDSNILLTGLNHILEFNLRQLL